MRRPADSVIDESLGRDICRFSGVRALILPRIIGVAPISAFPTAVLLMSFLAFFIGTFLQLLWEDLPITEPL